MISKIIFCLLSTKIVWFDKFKIKNHLSYPPIVSRPNLILFKFWYPKSNLIVLDKLNTETILVKITNI